jgi:mRNA interferase RelE/StbE
MYKVLVSRTFQKQFYALSEDMRDRVKNGLKELEIDPLKPRPNADIKPLRGTNPQKYRLRVGDYRIVYCIEGNEVKVIELFKRGRGYR